jgi:hypothetical protein
MRCIITHNVVVCMVLALVICTNKAHAYTFGRDTEWDYSSQFRHRSNDGSIHPSFLSDLYSADFAARDTYANDDSRDAFSFVHERIRKKDSSGDAVGGYVNKLVANTMDLTPSYHMNAQPYFTTSYRGEFFCLILS